MILCGGRGTRLVDRTREIPKPLIEIGGRPIVWHVIQLYAAQGFERFLLLSGYKSELIHDFVESEPWAPGLTVEAVPTGLDTPTGGRIARAAEKASGSAFCVTYGDGVADIALDAELRFHADHGGMATMAVVRPELQFGVTELAGDGRVTGFREKPRSEFWVNGGFFVFEPGVLDRLGDSSVLEREPLEGLAADGQLHAYRHEGFWECMDTYKDAVQLNDLWDSPHPPWKIWD